jgi:hypothetical protein
MYCAADPSDKQINLEIAVLPNLTVIMEDMG